MPAMIVAVTPPARNVMSRLTVTDGRRRRASSRVSKSTVVDCAKYYHSSDGSVLFDGRHTFGYSAFQRFQLLWGTRFLKRPHRCPARECRRRGRRPGEGEKNSPDLRRFDPFQRGAARKSRAMATMANVEILSVSLRTSREFNNRTAAERKVRRRDEGPPPPSTVTAPPPGFDGRRKVIVLSSPYEDPGDLPRSAAGPLRRWFAARIVAKFRKETGARRAYPRIHRFNCGGSPS